MGRPAGSRNRDHDETRHRLAAGLAHHLLRPDGQAATFKDLAAAAGVSAATLKHYFGDRAGVVAAVAEAFAVDAAPHLASMVEVDPGVDVAASLEGVLVGFLEAWRRHGVGRAFAGAVAVGLEHERNGPAVVVGVLEPFLQAMEELLSVHVARGDLPAIPLRESALTVVAPVLVALLHQDSLGGAGCRPLDVSAFIRVHVRSVVRGLQHP